MKKQGNNALLYGVAGMVCGAISLLAAAAQFRAGGQAGGWFFAIFGAMMVILGALMPRDQAAEKSRQTRHSVPIQLKEPSDWMAEALAALRAEEPDADEAATSAFNRILESNANSPEIQEALQWLWDQAFQEIGEAGLYKDFSALPIEKKFGYVQRCAEIPARPVLAAYGARENTLLNDDWKKWYATRFLHCAILSDLTGKAYNAGTNFVLTEEQCKGLDVERYARIAAAKGVWHRIRFVRELSDETRDDKDLGRYVGRMYDILTQRTYDLRIRYDHTEKGGSLEPDEVYDRVFWDEIPGA